MSLLSLFNQTNELFPSFSFICTGTHYGALPPMMMPNFPARASSIWWKNSWKRSTIWMKRYWCHVDWWIERLVYMFDLHFLFCSFFCFVGVVLFTSSLPLLDYIVIVEYSACEGEHDWVCEKKKTKSRIFEPKMSDKNRWFIQAETSGCFQTKMKNQFCDRSFCMISMIRVCLVWL